MNGLILGRFQLFHKGHQQLIDKALSECDKVLVFIGSAEKSGTKQNPFTYELRAKLINEIYGDKIILKPLNDLGVGNVHAWGDYVFKNALKYLDRVDIIYFGGEVKHELWYSEEYSKNTKFEVFDRKEIPISASLIREAIINDDYNTFEKFTDPKIHKFYDELKNILRKID